MSCALLAVLRPEHTAAHLAPPAVSFARAVCSRSTPTFRFTVLRYAPVLSALNLANCCLRRLEVVREDVAEDVAA